MAQLVLMTMFEASDLVREAKKSPGSVTAVFFAQTGNLETCTTGKLSIQHLTFAYPPIRAAVPSLFQSVLIFRVPSRKGNNIYMIYCVF